MRRILPFIIGLFILASFFRLGGVFIVIVIFAGIAWTARKMNAAAKSGDSAKLPQWQQLIQNGLMEIRRELKQRAAQQQQQPSQQTGWEQFVGQDAQPDLQPDLLLDPADIEAIAEDRPQEEAEKRTMAEAPLIAERPEDSSQISDPEQQTKTPPPLPRESAMATPPAIDLEQAVIWSEIISPPLALRGDGE